MTTYGKAIRALSDATRRTVFEQLRDGPSAVGDLAARVPVSRPAVSQHLKVLKTAGLVREEKVGTRRIYSVEAAGLAELRRYLDTFWSDVLEEFADFADRQEPGDQQEKSHGTD